MFIESYNSMNAAKFASAADKKAAQAEQVAKDFEAMFTSILFKSMRSAIGGKDSLIPKNMGEDIFTEMLDGEYAKLSAQSGSLGLAALILKEIQRADGINGNPENVLDSRYKPFSFANNTALIRNIRERYDDIIKTTSARFGVDENLVAAVIARESAGNPNAISPKGAKGLMQLMDGTARDMGVTLSFSPAQNILGGVKYLKLMLDTFNGNEELALAGYNAGPNAVKRFGGIPPYRETQEYVKAVLMMRELAAKIANGENATESENTENINENANNNAV